jgi:hypothetical protein
MLNKRILINLVSSNPINTMKTKTLGIFVMMLLISTAGFAQELFKVLASKGTNKAVSGGVESGLVIGKKLLKGDKIIVAEGGYVGLAHTSGKTIEIKKGGSYDVATLVNEVSNQNTSSSQKYVNFVSTQMTSGNTTGTNKNSTGSVERGGNYKLFQGTRMEVYNTDKILVKWLPVEKSKGFYVTLVNMYDEEIFKSETNDNSIVLDLSQIDGSKLDDNSAKIVIVAKNDPGLKTDDSYFITFITGDKQKKVAEELTAMQQFNGENTAINKIVLAGFYEENGLYLNAMEKYQEAIALEPEVEDYKTAYDQFLKRNELIPTPVK